MQKVWKDNYFRGYVQVGWFFVYIIEVYKLKCWNTEKIKI